MNVIAAIDFFTVDVLAWSGIVTKYVLFAMDLETRKVTIAGITTNPNEEFVCQVARNLTEDVDGFLTGNKYLIHDRDTKFTDRFSGILSSGGIKTIKLPARSPNLNAFAERFVLSVKSECTSQMIILGEAGLRHILTEYLEHYHAERNHQGVGNVILFPDINSSMNKGKIKRSERLGGLLKHYSRAA